VFHHLAPDTKARALAEVRRVLRPGGRLVIADYGGPRDPLMRAAFLCVQFLDGFQGTRQHAAGKLPELIAQAGFDVHTIDRLRTLSGALELLAATPTMPPRKDEMPIPATAGSS
jgi:SAM-dependent methyltransferase